MFSIMEVWDLISVYTPSSLMPFYAFIQFACIWMLTEIRHDSFLTHTLKYVFHNRFNVFHV